MGHEEHRVHLPAAELAPAFAMMAIGHLLEQRQPPLIQLHGNGLVGRHGGLVLLVGGSGVGKSTLSGLLPDSVLVTEDLLILEPSSRLLHPFPRAAALKQPSATSRGEALRLDGRTVYLEQRAHVVTEPIRLAGARVILLRRPQPEDTPSSQRMAFSSLPESLRRELEEEAGAPLQTVRGSNSVVVEWSSTSRPEVLARAGTLALKHGAFMLGTGDARASAPPAHEPAIRSLKGSEALPALLPHLRRYGAPAREHGRCLMQLAGLFTDAEFHELTVGGTPQDTAALIRGLAQGR